MCPGSFLHRAYRNIMPKALEDSFTATLSFTKLEVAAKQLGSINGILGGIPPDDGRSFVKRFAKRPTSELMVSVPMVLFLVFLGRAEHPTISFQLWNARVPAPRQEPSVPCGEVVPGRFESRHFPIRSN